MFVYTHICTPMVNSDGKHSKDHLDYLSNLIYKESEPQRD